MRAIERQVNDWVMSNDEVITQLMSLDEAMESGATALFGEKYDEEVRVLRVGDYSK